MPRIEPQFLGHPTYSTFIVPTVLSCLHTHTHTHTQKHVVVLLANNENHYNIYSHCVGMHTVFFCEENSSTVVYVSLYSSELNIIKFGMQNLLVFMIANTWGMEVMIAEGFFYFRVCMGLVRLVLEFGRDHSLPIFHTFMKVIFQHQAQQHLNVMGKKELHIQNVMVLVTTIPVVQNVLCWMRMYVIV
jgi:hypothetical protein